MKKFFAFLKWHISKWSPTQRLWMLGAFFFGAGAMDYIETGKPNTSIFIAWACWIAVFVKWFMWDTAVDSWKQFEGERKDLFKTIDEGK
jgi:hypothetical protein